VGEAEMLSIGSFSLLTGLSIPSLRHYDEIELLQPASVGQSSRYRYYRRSQVRDGHVVRTLRALEMPLSEIKMILENNDHAHTRERLIAHRERLVTQTRLLQHQLASLDDLIERGVPMTTAQRNRIVMINIAVDDLQSARQFYETLLNVEFAEEHHDEGPPHLNATFGDWSTPNWFLLALWPDKDRAGGADVGFLVGNLDDAFARALAAGATEIHAPRDIRGMPRMAQLKDPSGNDIGLYQA
jgi:DNA-binding transcriptional MerR regulator